MKNTLPGYVINSTTIAVDYWPRNEPKITHYFLTHAHTDHTKGLDESWNGPVLYCSTVIYLISLNHFYLRNFY